MGLQENTFNNINFVIVDGAMPTKAQPSTLCSETNIVGVEAGFEWPQQAITMSVGYKRVLQGTWTPSKISVIVNATLLWSAKGRRQNSSVASGDVLQRMTNVCC